MSKAPPLYFLFISFINAFAECTVSNHLLKTVVHEVSEADFLPSHFAQLKLFLAFIVGVYFWFFRYKLRLLHHLFYLSPDIGVDFLLSILSPPLSSLQSSSLDLVFAFRTHFFTIFCACWLNCCGF